MQFMRRAEELLARRMPNHVAEERPISEVPEAQLANYRDFLAFEALNFRINRKRRVIAKYDDVANFERRAHDWPPAMLLKPKPSGRCDQSGISSRRPRLLGMFFLLRPWLANTFGRYCAGVI